jgi:CBS domain-containing protein
MQEDSMKVKDVMHQGATCVELSTPLREIAKRMRDADVGAIPVRANGQLVGIVTDRDIACRALADSGDVAKMTAKDVMSRDVVCCSEDDDVEIAIDVMEAKQIRRLPVTDSHKAMIGMLSLGDISHKVSKELSAEVLRAVSGHHL